MKIADVVPSSLSASLCTALLFITRNAGLKQLILSLCFPFFPVFLHTFPTIYVTTVKLYLSFFIVDTNAYLTAPFVTSYAWLNLSLYSENGGFTSQSKRVGRNNPIYLFRGVQLVVTKISHLLCDRGVKNVMICEQPVNSGNPKFC